MALADDWRGILTTILWAEKPTWGRVVLTGACTALAFLSKFSALEYFTISVSCGSLLLERQLRLAA